MDTSSHRVAAALSRMQERKGRDQALAGARASSGAGARPTDTRALALGRKQARGALLSALCRVRITGSEVLVTRAKQGSGQNGVNATQLRATHSLSGSSSSSPENSGVMRRECG
jgi:hypothetical protein